MVLENCPFCGSDNVAVRIKSSSSEEHIFYAMCDNCKAIGPIPNYDLIPNKTDRLIYAFNSWNSRF